MDIITGDYFGRKNFGTICGIIQGISTFGSIAGPLIAGLVYDIKGIIIGLSPPLP